MVVRGGASSSRGGRRGGRGRGMHCRHIIADGVDRRPPLYPQGTQDSPLSHTQSLQDTFNTADNTSCPVDALDGDPTSDHIPETSPPPSASSRTRGLNQGTPEPIDPSTRQCITAEGGKYVMVKLLLVHKNC